jgi:hypothetical protein
MTDAHPATETVHVCAHGKDWQKCELCRAEYFGNRSSKQQLRLKLPKITREIVEAHGGRMQLIEGAGELYRWNWTQEAVDFACLLQTTAEGPAVEREGMWEREYRIEHARVERLTAELLEAQKRLSSSVETLELCPHGYVLADNICGPCSEGRPNRRAEKTAAKRCPDCKEPWIDGDEYCRQCGGRNSPENGKGDA